MSSHRLNGRGAQVPSVIAPLNPRRLGLLLVPHCERRSAHLGHAVAGLGHRCRASSAQWLVLKNSACKVTSCSRIARTTWVGDRLLSKKGCGRGLPSSST